MVQEGNKSSKLFKKQVLLISVGILLLSVVIAGFFIWQIASDKTKNTLSEIKYEKPEDVLKFPGQDSSDDLLSKHINLVLDTAVETNTVKLQDCKPTPLVADVPFGSDIIFKNMDNSSHTVYLVHEVTNDRADVEVRSNGEERTPIAFFNPNFLHSFAMVKYGCDNPNKVSGIILVKDKPVLP